MRAAVIGLAVLLAGCDSLDGDIRHAEAMVRRDQRDPDAAQFRDVKKCPTGFYVTGEVNGKNAYGAYTGFKTFYANSAEAHIVGEDQYTDEERYRKLCDNQAFKEAVLNQIDADSSRNFEAEARQYVNRIETSTPSTDNADEGADTPPNGWGD